MFLLMETHKSLMSFPTLQALVCSHMICVTFNHFLYYLLCFHLANGKKIIRLYVFYTVHFNSVCNSFQTGAGQNIHRQISSKIKCSYKKINIISNYSHF